MQAGDTSPHLEVFFIVAMQGHQEFFVPCCRLSIPRVGRNQNPASQTAKTTPGRQIGRGPGSLSRDGLIPESSESLQINSPQIVQLQDQVIIRQKMVSETR